MFISNITPKFVDFVGKSPVFGAFLEILAKN